MAGLVLPIMKRAPMVTRTSAGIVIIHGFLATIFIKMPNPTIIKPIARGGRNHA